jgi:hypothetical protein
MRQPNPPATTSPARDSLWPACAVEVVGRTTSSRFWGCERHAGCWTTPGLTGQRGQLPVGVASRPPGAARVEQQSVRYAARSQPLDWHFDRHDHMSTAPPSTDLTPTAPAPRTTRPVLRSVPEVCGGGPATPELDADLVAAEVLNLTRLQGRSRLSLADGTAVRRHPERSGHVPDNA